MATFGFLKLDAQLFDAHSRQSGRQVVRFSPRHADTDPSVALKLIAACSLSGERSVVPAGRCLSHTPDVAQISQHGEIARWVCIEPVNASPVLQAARNASEVVVLFASLDTAQAWWRRAQKRLRRSESVTVLAVDVDGVNQVVQLIAPVMTWHCTLDGDSLVLCAGDVMVPLELIQVNPVTAFAERKTLRA